LAKPKLIILAGPNGAGKSTFAEHLDLKFITELGIESFDYDLEFRKLYERFESVMSLQMEENLSVRAKELFEERANEALENKKHFSFQTNYDKEYTDEWRKKFADAGFDTELYFLYVDDIDLCISRVAKRVSAGGHDVPQDEIISRYSKGLFNYDRTFKDFNKVIVIDTSNIENRALLEISNRQAVFISPLFVDLVFSHSLEHSKEWIMKLSK
jgi:predicted ABC-type ATPase